MKIFVLFTGGTIGSVADGSVVDVSKNTNYMLLASYYKAFPSSKVQFIPENLFHVLSENMVFSHWKCIYDKVNSISKIDYDGIIITHGTDTLAYTATFLSFMLRQVDVPVLLVCANYPLDDERSNGLHNFSAAVDFIEKNGTKGVFVPFWENGISNIHLGSRLLQAQPYTHCFNSLGNVPYGQMIKGEFERNPDKNNPTPEEIETISVVVPYFPNEKTVIYIEPYLGIDYSVLDFSKKPDAILHGLFHSGTACTTHESEKNSVIVFARRYIAQGIDFYTAPYDSGHPMYITSKEMVDVGVKFINNVSSIAAYTKLLIAYGSFSGAVERQNFIDSNIACEQLIT